MVTARLPQDEIDRAVEALRDGEVVAFPTETVYGLGADAQNPEAVRKVCLYTPSSRTSMASAP